MNGLVIGGHHIAGVGEEIVSINPSTNDVSWRGPSGSTGQVNDAIAAAKGVFADWALRDINARIEIVERYRDIIKRDADELARLISEETGKPYWETKTEAAARCRQSRLVDQSLQ